MEQIQKFHNSLLPHSLPPPPKLSVGFERLFFKNLPDFNIEIGGTGVEIAKFGNFCRFPIYFVRNCLKKKLNKNPGKKGESKVYLKITVFTTKNVY